MSRAFLPSSAIFSTTILVWSSLILNKAYFLFFFVLISWNASTTESSTVIPDCAWKLRVKKINEFSSYPMGKSTRLLAMKFNRKGNKFMLGSTEPKHTKNHPIFKLQVITGLIYIHDVLVKCGRRRHLNF